MLWGKIGAIRACDNIKQVNGYKETMTEFLNQRNNVFFQNEREKLKVRFCVSVQHSKRHSKPQKNTQ